MRTASRQLSAIHKRTRALLDECFRVLTLADLQVGFGQRQSAPLVAALMEEPPASSFWRAPAPTVTSQVAAAQPLELASAAEALRYAHGSLCEALSGRATGRLPLPDPVPRAWVSNSRSAALAQSSGILCKTPVAPCTSRLCF